eukprot:3791936-Rhodomonas_salina.2
MGLYRRHLLPHASSRSAVCPRSCYAMRFQRQRAGYVTPGSEIVTPGSEIGSEIAYGASPRACARRDPRCETPAISLRAAYAMPCTAVECLYQERRRLQSRATRNVPRTLDAEGACGGTRGPQARRVGTVRVLFPAAVGVQDRSAVCLLTCWVVLGTDSAYGDAAVSANALSGTETRAMTIGLHACYALPSTHIAYFVVTNGVLIKSIVLRALYKSSGTDIWRYASGGPPSVGSLRYHLTRALRNPMY